MLSSDLIETFYGFLLSDLFVDYSFSVTLISIPVVWNLCDLLLVEGSRSLLFFMNLSVFGFFFSFLMIFNV